MSQQFYSIEAIAERVATQGNDCTADPYFVVQERHTITGIDTGWVDEVAWRHDGEVYLPGSEDFGNAEMRYRETGEEPEDWTRTGYAFRWESSQFFMTREAAQQYIATKSHRHSGPLRIYTESAHGNPEIRALRQHLLAAAAAGMVVR